MRQAIKKKADRYIERGGYLPGERRERFPADLLVVASFLAYCDPKEIMGGETAGDAFLALCRILNFDPVELRKVVKGESCSVTPEPKKPC